MGAWGVIGTGSGRLSEIAPLPSDEPVTNMLGLASTPRNVTPPSCPDPRTGAAPWPAAVLPEPTFPLFLQYPNLTLIPSSYDE